MVEEEINMLERKVDELTMQLYQERAQGRELDIRHQKRVWQQNHLLCEAEDYRSALNDQRSRSQNYEVLRKERVNGDRRASLSSASDNRTWSSTCSNSNKLLVHIKKTELSSSFFLFFSFSLMEFHVHIIEFVCVLTGEIAELTRRVNRRSRRRGKVDNESGLMRPNELSEELLKCLIGIFHELNQTSLDREGSPIVRKLALSCMNSKGFMGKTSFNCKPTTFLFNDSSSNSDPYGILPDLDVRDVGPYKNFIQITSSSVDVTRFSECLTGFRKLRFAYKFLEKKNDEYLLIQWLKLTFLHSLCFKFRVLMHKLCAVDLTFLTYKQKLAFWINIYNVCIMHVL